MAALVHVWWSLTSWRNSPFWKYFCDYVGLAHLVSETELPTTWVTFFFNRHSSGSRKKNNATRIIQSPSTQALSRVLARDSGPFCLPSGPPGIPTLSLLQSLATTIAPTLAAPHQFSSPWVEWWGIITPASCVSLQLSELRSIQLPKLEL